MAVVLNDLAQVFGRRASRFSIPDTEQDFALHALKGRVVSGFRAKKITRVVHRFSLALQPIKAVRVSTGCLWSGGQRHINIVDRHSRRLPLHLHNAPHIDGRLLREDVFEVSSLYLIIGQGWVAIHKFE